MSDTKGRVAARRALVYIAILVAIPTYLAEGAKLWWVLDLVTHFRVFYALALLPLVLILLAKKKWRLFAFTAIALVINLRLVAPLYFHAGVSPSSESLRIVSINVWARNSQHERVLQVIRRENPDFVLLIEVGWGWQPVLETLKSEFPYSLSGARAGTSGIAFFSKLPLEDMQFIDLGTTGLPSIKATVKIGGTTVEMIGAHFMSPVGRERSRRRNKQLLVTAHAMANLPHACLLVGDLNITPWSPYFRDLLMLGKLRNSQAGFGVQPTWLGSLPIDHLLHSDDIVILDRRIGPSVGSDHWPLIVDFALKKKP